MRMTHIAGLWAAGALVLCAGAASAQTAGGAPSPKNEYGQPDLQGLWTNATLTPFERPATYGDRLVMTPDEVAKAEGDNAKTTAANNAPTDPKLKVTDLPYDCGGGFKGVDCGYNASWVDPGSTVMRVHGEPRTSLITDPANGRAPPPLPAARAALMARFAGLRASFGRADNPETRSLGEQCLLSFGNSAGPVMLPLLYNNNYQIVQTKTEVAILVEMVHDVRIVRLGGTHLPSNLRPWLGDSIGHYEGATLVVETTNFPEAQNFRGSSANLKVTERFTRVGPNRILYQFRVEDPTVWAAPWGGEYEFAATKGPIYEYACHEGNYALADILSGARAQDQAAAQGGASAAPAATAPAATSAGAPAAASAPGK
jgi:hypothetical protein